MTTAKEFTQIVLEAKGKLVKKVGIKDGKKQVVTSREYTTECPDGYKRDSETGKCVRMDQKEKTNRSKASTKAAAKSSTKLHKKTSNRRRSSLISKD